MVSTVVGVERFLQNAVSTMQLVHSIFGMKGGGSWQILITVSTNCTNCSSLGVKFHFC